MKKKSLFLFFLLIALLCLSGCYNKVEEFFYIEQVETISINIGEPLYYSNVRLEEDNGVLESDMGIYYGAKAGSVVINCKEGKYLVEVCEEDIQIKTSCVQRLIIGESTKIQCKVYPTTKSQEVNFKCSNSDVLEVTSDGTCKAISSGVCIVTITTDVDLNYKKELTFIVLDKEEEYYEKSIETIVNEINNNKDLNSENDVLNPIIETNINSLVGVSASGFLSSTFASGIVYKMNVHFKDEAVKEDVKDITNLKNISYFEYYVITNRHIIENKKSISIYLGEDLNEEEATLVQYDDKIDLAVIKFTSSYYIPVATFGDSSTVQKGEFIVSIGNGEGKEYFRSSTFGILSSENRYISDDTDNDNVNDWDSQYLQHDASLNEGDTGGAILNMQGEIIGINTTKISNYKYNNMSFAIPINLVLSIVKQLEQGIRPERLTLGIQIIDVSNYRQNKDYYLSIYPSLNIPDDLKYGFCVTSITSGGFADKANMQVGDIIIKFNDIDIKYTYELRSELGKYLKDSGDIATVVVLRNGVEVELNVKF